MKDPVMAEYITIMIINNKTAGECSSPLMKEEALTAMQPKYRRNSKTVRFQLIIVYETHADDYYSDRIRLWYVIWEL